ncbi:hypothetical protein ACRALDRAFT_2023950 [Sodiomyces alcalophilus JCM 7366]|uniref:uncharacterized protein n=1 Tax=Sodiomyces alcalophilus JCM 7366 TaxID=591952 RepID=UPI0039B66BD2
MATKGKGKKTTRSTNASKSERASRRQPEPEPASETPTEPEPQSEPQVPILPQDENEELSFGDQIQSTPKQHLPRPRGAVAQESEVRSPLAERDAPEDELADESVDTPGPSRKGQRRRGRVSDSVAGAGDDAESIEGPTAPSQTATTGVRPRQQKSAPDSTRNGKPKTATKLRPSRPLRRKEPTADAPEPTQQRRRKPPSQQISDAPPSDRAKRSNRTTTRPSGDVSPAPPREEPQPPSKKRRRTEADTNNPPTESSPRDPPPPPSPPRKYRRIAPRNLTIPRTKIEESWTPLPTASIALASSLLHLAERPILQGLSNPKRRSQAAQALRVVSGHLTRRLTRNFPFPPALSQSSSSTAARRTSSSGGPKGNGNKNGKPVADPRDEELDFDRCVAATQSLERTQDTLLHGNQLLRAELAREEAALERDSADLDALEANARSEIRGLRDGLRKAHPLVPQPQPQSPAQGHETPVASQMRQDLTFRVAGPDGEGGPGSGPLFHDIDHPELFALGTQVASHMESMRANLRPVADVFPEITRSRAALRDVLAKYLDGPQYDDVILG